MLVVALLGAGVQTFPPASAATTFNVEVGRFFDPNDNSSESLRFYPAGLQVHQGDVVHFSTESFHGVSLLPAGVNASNWLRDYAGGIDKPFSLFESDPDDGVASYKINLRLLSPSLPCGWPTQDACSFDGSNPNPISGVLHSGLAVFPTAGGSETTQLSFSVAVDADPGVAFDVVDVLHPGMRMRIEVVPASMPASDQTELDKESARLFGLDSRKAASLHKTYSAKKTKRKIGGVTTWSAWAGVETPTVSLRRMYPPILTIKPGEQVRWLFTKNRYSAHTVTFPMARGRKLAASFPVITCDLDGDSPDPTADQPPHPDGEPTSSSPPYCASFDQLELDVPDGVPNLAGDGRVTSASDLESSGVRGRGIANSVAPYTLAFTKPRKKGYSMIDMVSHLARINATGKIVVRGR